MEDVCSSQNAPSRAATSMRRRRQSSTYSSRTHHAAHSEGGSHRSPAKLCDSDTDEPAATPTRLSSFHEACSQPGYAGTGEYDECTTNERECAAGTGSIEAEPHDVDFLSQHTGRVEEGGPGSPQTTIRDDNTLGSSSGRGSFATRNTLNEQQGIVGHAGSHTAYNYSAVAQHRGSSFTVQQPVIHFLSSLQLQGYARRVVEECDVTTMSQLVARVTCEQSAAELLGGYASMQHKRDLVKGVRRWGREHRHSRRGTRVSAVKAGIRGHERHSVHGIEAMDHVPPPPPPSCPSSASSSSFLSLVLPRYSESSSGATVDWSSVAHDANKEGHGTAARVGCDAGAPALLPDTASIVRNDGAPGDGMMMGGRGCGGETATGAWAVPHDHRCDATRRTAAIPTVRTVGGDACDHDNSPTMGGGGGSVPRGRWCVPPHLDAPATMAAAQDEEDTNRVRCRPVCGVGSAPPRAAGTRCPVAFMQSLRYRCRAPPACGPPAVPLATEAMLEPTSRAHDALLGGNAAKEEEEWVRVGDRAEETDDEWGEGGRRCRGKSPPELSRPSRSVLCFGRGCRDGAEAPCDGAEEGRREAMVVRGTRAASCAMGVESNTPRAPQAAEEEGEAEAEEGEAVAPAASCAGSRASRAVCELRAALTRDIGALVGAYNAQLRQVAGLPARGGGHCVCDGAEAACACFAGEDVVVHWDDDSPAPHRPLWPGWIGQVWLTHAAGRCRDEATRVGREGDGACRHRADTPTETPAVESVAGRGGSSGGGGGGPAREVVDVDAPDTPTSPLLPLLLPLRGDGALDVRHAEDRSTGGTAGEQAKGTARDVPRGVWAEEEEGEEEMLGGDAIAELESLCARWGLSDGSSWGAAPSSSSPRVRQAAGAVMYDPALMPVGGACVADVATRWGDAAQCPTATDAQEGGGRWAAGGSAASAWTERDTYVRLHEEYLRAQLRLNAVRGRFQRRVAPHALHRIESVSAMEYRRIRASALMAARRRRWARRAGGGGESAGRHGGAYAPALAGLRQRARAVAQAETDRCMVAALCAADVWDIERFSVTAPHHRSEPSSGCGRPQADVKPHDVCDDDGECGGGGGCPCASLEDATRNTEGDRIAVGNTGAATLGTPARGRQPCGEDRKRCGGGDGVAGQGFIQDTGASLDSPHRTRIQTRAACDGGGGGGDASAHTLPLSVYAQILLLEPVDSAKMVAVVQRHFPHISSHCVARFLARHDVNCVTASSPSRTRAPVTV